MPQTQGRVIPFFPPHRTLGPAPAVLPPREEGHHRAVGTEQIDAKDMSDSAALVNYPALQLPMLELIN